MWKYQILAIAALAAVPIIGQATQTPCETSNIRITAHPNDNGGGTAHTVEMDRGVGLHSHLPGIGGQRSFKYNHNFLPVNVDLVFSDGSNKFNFFANNYAYESIVNLGFAATQIDLTTYLVGRDAAPIEKKAAGIYNVTADGDVVYAGPLPEEHRIQKRAVDFTTQTFTYGERTIRPANIDTESPGPHGNAIENDANLFDFFCPISNAYWLEPDQNHGHTVVVGGRAVGSVGSYVYDSSLSYDTIPGALFAEFVRTFATYIAEKGLHGASTDIYDMNGHRWLSVWMYGAEN